MIIAATAVAFASLVATHASIDDKALARIGNGEIVHQRTLRDGVVRTSVVARIDAPREDVLLVARDACAFAKYAPPKSHTRYLAAADVERLLPSLSGVDDDRLRALPSLACADASTRDLFYGLYEDPGSALMPPMRALIRYEASADELRSRQVLGGVDGVRFENAVEIVALADGATALEMRGLFTVPKLVPDFIVENVLDSMDAQNPASKRIDELRARSRSVSRHLP